MHSPDGFFEAGLRVRLPKKRPRSLHAKFGRDTFSGGRDSFSRFFCRPKFQLDEVVFLVVFRCVRARLKASPTVALSAEVSGNHLNY